MWRDSDGGLLLSGCPNPRVVSRRIRRPTRLHPAIRHLFRVENWLKIEWKLHENQTKQPPSDRIRQPWYFRGFLYFRSLELSSCYIYTQFLWELWSVAGSNPPTTRNCSICAWASANQKSRTQSSRTTTMLWLCWLRFVDWFTFIVDPWCSWLLSQKSWLRHLMLKKGLAPALVILSIVP